jgi:hypothetical protein
MGMAGRDTLLDGVWTNAIKPALALLAPGMNTPQAWHMLLAIGLQESLLCARCQVLPGGGRGPAHGLWQAEQGGSVRGVLRSPATRELAQAVCTARGVAAEPGVVWAAIEHDDVLAAAFARLTLWADPHKLPERDGQDQAWALYAIHAWRPGKPHPEKWPANWLRARLYVYGS